MQLGTLGNPLWWPNVPASLSPLRAHFVLGLFFMNTNPPRMPGQLSFMALIVVFSAFMLWSSFRISKFDSISSPGVFPMLCAGLMLVTGLMSLRQAWKASPSADTDQTVFQQFVIQLAPLKLILFVALILAYMLALEVTGFLVSSYVFLLLSMQVLGSKKIFVNIWVSALVLFCIFIVFRTAFSVVLPAGSLLGPYTPEFLK